MLTGGASDTDDLAVRVAWLAYIGGHTQASIAERFDLSRAKVHRLITQAHDAGYVHVFIDRSPKRLIELGDALCDRYALSSCIVVPDVGDSDYARGSGAALGAAAARTLHNRLDRGGVHTLGVTWGRSLAEMARRLPRERRSDLTVVSLMGSLTRKSAVNPFDVVHRITDVTQSDGFFIPAPFIADSLHDKDTLMQQRSVRTALAAARDAQLCYVGIGSISVEQPMFVEANGLFGAERVAELLAAGAHGELLGRFLDAEGRELDIELNKRVIGLSIDELRERETIGVAGGRGKVGAIRSVLKSGALTGLIVDENAAAELCDTKVKTTAPSGG